MSDKAFIIKKEIIIISRHRALVISKHILTFVLSSLALYVGIRGYAVSPLYILLVLNALPPILTSSIHNYNQQKSANKVHHFTNTNQIIVLIGLKNKYRYSRIRYIANSVAFITSLFLLSIWHYSYQIAPIKEPVLNLLPFILLLSIILFRILLYIVYRVKIPYDLSHNRV